MGLPRHRQAATIPDSPSPGALRLPQWPRTNAGHCPNQDHPALGIFRMMPKPARRPAHRPARDSCQPARERADLLGADHRGQFGHSPDRHRTGHPEGGDRQDSGPRHQPGLQTNGVFNGVFIESSAAATTAQGGGGFAGLVSSTLVQGDATAIASSGIPGVTAVAARMSIDAQATAGGNNAGAGIVSTSGERADVRDLAFRRGSFSTP